MGIRINKELAFIVKLENVSNLNKVQEKIYENIENLKGSCFLEKVKLYDTSFFNINNIKNEDSLSSSVEIIDAEFDFAKTGLLIFRIPGCKDHSRYDNIIDYIENEDARNKIKYIHREIFPYVEKFISLHNKEEISQKDLTIIRACSKRDFIKKIEKDYFTELVKKYKFNFYKNLSDQYHMLPPKEIKFLAKLVGLKENEIKKIRPAIITYWM